MELILLNVEQHQGPSRKLTFQVQESSSVDVLQLQLLQLLSHLLELLIPVLHLVLLLLLCPREF